MAETVITINGIRFAPNHGTIAKLRDVDQRRPYQFVEVVKKAQYDYVVSVKAADGESFQAYKPERIAMMGEKGRCFVYAGMKELDNGHSYHRVEWAPKDVTLEQLC